MKKFFSKHIFVFIFMASLFGGLQAQHLPQASYTPGTYTWNTGNYIFHSVTIRAWGGGAGGGTGTQGNGGGGGGGGAFVERLFSTVGPFQTVTLVVGAGGLAGVPGGNFGQPGADSYFVVTSQETRAGGGGIQSPTYSSASTGGVPSGTRDKGFNGGGGSGKSGQRGGGGGSSAGTTAQGVTATGPDGAIAPVRGGNGGSSGVGPNDPAFPGQVPGGGGGGCQVQGGKGGDGRITISYVTVEEGAPLPIELTFFNVIQDGQNVQLAWSTASETNNEYFMVQHSTNGHDYTDIVTLIGAGTTTREHSYSYKHMSPSSGTNYYRLKQVDYDGAFTFSPVRVVELYGSSSTPNTWTIQPTVATNQIYLFRHAEAIAANWTVYTMDGRPTLYGNIPTDGDIQAIEISTLHAGLYVLQVMSSEGIWSGRLVKE